MQYHDYCPNCSYKLTIEEYPNNYVIMDNGKIVERCPRCDIRLVIVNGELKEDKI